MKYPQKNAIYKGATFLFLLLLGTSIYNAKIIHFFYRIMTKDEDREKYFQRYHYLALEELTAYGKKRESMREERWKIYYWFHARGWGIDEDEESQNRPWQDLQIYWSYNKEDELPRSASK